jgi:hypothetical protein
MSRIYIGSKLQTLSSISLEFPKRKIENSYDAELQSKNYSFFFSNEKIILHHNPNENDLSVIYNDIQKNKGTHFLFFEDESYDGRNKLIQSIKKSNQIFDYSYPLVGDLSGLKRIVTNYLKSKNCSIDFSCFDWLNKNCPTYKIKSTKSGSKKEILCYDIDLIYKELELISSIKNHITIEDFEHSLFNNDSNVFDFIDNIFLKKTEDSFVSCEKLMNEIGEQGLLLILLAQLQFLLTVSGCKEKNIFTNSQVTEITEFKDLLGKYLDCNWQTGTFTPKIQNPIRIKIEMSNNTFSTKRLSCMITSVVETIVELRNNGKKEHCMFFLLNKLLSV